jgi:hypothetical protein
MCNSILLLSVRLQDSQIIKSLPLVEVQDNFFSSLNIV